MATVYLVWNSDKSECVGFTDKKDAQFAATGNTRGAFGVSYIADLWREAYDEQRTFEMTEIEIE